jgi:mono/diheme cytochrome c family protein
MKLLKLAVALLLLVVVGGAAFVWSGFYDISATDQHLPPTYHLIELTMRRSVERRGAGIPVPQLGGEAQLARGLALFRRHCVQCHGAPGVAPEPFALGLTPLPAPLMQTGREWPPGELFWVVKHGIKMTGMPAWKYRLADEEIWALVAFMRAQLPYVSPKEYAALHAPAVASVAPVPHAPDPARGREALQQYACVSCHRIPGVTGAEARVGPPLDRIGSRQILGGVLPNSPENLARWIRFPHELSPLGAMPGLGVSERDARDIAAYLATLK